MPKPAKYDPKGGGRLYYLGEEVGIKSVKNKEKSQDGEQNEEYGEDVWPEEGDCEVPL